MNKSVRGLARQRALVLLLCQLLPIIVFLTNDYPRRSAHTLGPAEEDAASLYGPEVLLATILGIAVILSLYNVLYKLVRRKLGWPRWLYILVGGFVFLTVQLVTGGLDDSYGAWTGTVQPLLIAALLDLVIYTLVMKGMPRSQKL